MRFRPKPGFGFESLESFKSLTFFDFSFLSPDFRRLFSSFDSILSF